MALQFCAIAPIKWLSKVEEVRPPEQRTHMALAQYLRWPRYFSYFKGVLARGEKVILDNGAYEGTLLPEEVLFERVSLLKPTVVVLPDVPNSFEKTIALSENYLKRYPIPEVSHMYVVHTDGKKETSLDSYKAGLDLGCTWIALSRLTQDYGFPCSYKWTRRVYFVTQLRDLGLWSDSRRYHALGMLSGEKEELRGLKKEGFHSIDSSAPVWRGLHGYGTASRLWPNYGFDPLIGSELDWEFAARNLKEAYELCK